MQINFETDKFIVAHYCGGAGGKFLLNCLAVANEVLHMSKEFAKVKIKGRWTEDQSVKASRVPSLLSMKHNTHVEFDHGVDIYGWDQELGKSSQIANATDFFKTLTHQEEYYFTHSNHGYYQNFIHYSQCQNVIIDKCDQLLKIRDMLENKEQWSVGTKQYVPLMQNKVYFNIDTFLDPTKFKNEMKQLFEYLKINFDRYDLIETLRQDFHDQQVVKVKGTSRARWFRERYESRQNQ
jgi:hypothetical protein